MYENKREKGKIEERRKQMLTVEVHSIWHINRLPFHAVELFPPVVPRSLNERVVPGRINSTATRTTAWTASRVHGVVDEGKDTEFTWLEVAAVRRELRAYLLCKDGHVGEPELHVVLQEVGPVVDHEEEEEGSCSRGLRLIVAKHCPPADVSLYVGGM